MKAPAVSLSPADASRLEEVERSLRQSGVAALVAMLDEPSWAVRRVVIAAVAARGDEATGPLTEELRTHRDSEGRIAAVVDALSALSGDPVAALVALADDPNVAVAADVAQILGRRRANAALPTVIRLSRHADDNVAAAAMEALGRIGGRAAIDSLIDAVRSANFFRVFPAIDVLGRSGDPRVVEPLAALLTVQPYAAEVARALGRTGEVAAVAPLIDLLLKAPLPVSRLPAVALADLHRHHRERYGSGTAVEDAMRARAAGATVGRQLLLALSGGDDNERAAICLVLGVLGDPAAAVALTPLLDGPPVIAEAAATALRQLGSSIERQIIEELQTGDSAHRRVLLPFISSRAATDIVVACLRDEDPDVRIMASEALGRVGAVAAVGPLFAFLQDTDARVSYAALGAIQSLGGADTERLALEGARSSNVQLRRAALRILSYFGASAALDVFLAAIHDPDERVRESAIQGLPFMEDARAFEALVLAAKDAAPRTRAAAMRSLGQCAGDLRASGNLLRGLDDSDAWVRYYACQALGKLAFEPAASAIIKLLADPAGQVRVSAVEALSCLTSEVAVRALESAAGDADSDIQRAAIVGLGVAHRAEGLPLVLRALGSEDSATRLVGVSALAGFRAPDVVPALSTAAADEAESVRTSAIGFLSAMRGPQATRALVDLIPKAAQREPVLAALALPVEGRIDGLAAALEVADDETAPALTSALARMRRPDAVALLMRALQMTNVAARKAAAGVLAVIGSKEAVAALQKAATDDPAAEVRQICSVLLAR